MAIRIIRAADCRVVPWKNGGGSTTEIAVAPEGASFDDFDWRISMARVASDGPFSHFANIDRTLAVIEGQGLVLTIGDNAPVELTTASDPVSFPGDTPTAAHLTDGAIVDLNVMTRRGRFRHVMSRVAQANVCDLADTDMAVVLSLGGATTISGDGEPAILDHGDAAIVTRPASVQINLKPSATCYLVRLWSGKVAGVDFPK